MNGTKRSTLGTLAAVVGALLLAGSTAQADAHSNGYRDRSPAKGRRYDHRQSEKVRHRVDRYRQPVDRWVAPAPRFLPRPRWLPRPRAFTIPRAMRVDNRHAYAPYRINLDVYYFPVSVGGRMVYQPYYYYQDELFFMLSVGGPRFYFRLNF
jgi:hypothetical protein